MQASSFTANICLSFSTLVFILLTKEIYFKPMPKGDYGVGYAWLAILLNLAFILLIAVSMLAIGSRGGFQWVASSGASRLGRTLLGFLFIAFAVGVSGMSIGGGPAPLKLVSKVLAFAVPIAALAAGFLLANDKLVGGVPAPAARWLSLLVFGCSGFFASVFLVVLMVPGIRNIHTTVNYDRNKLDSFQQGILVNIDSCDINKDMVFMLVHTDANRNPIIRERAVAKVKTRPDWQEELVRQLDSDWASEVFTFLASNEVEDKSLFPEAVRLGVLRQAEIVRQSIRESNSLYAGQYTSEVDQVLRTVEKFDGMGVDYLPAVQNLRAAFDERSPFEKPKFLAIPMLDKWIKKR